MSLLILDNLICQFEDGHCLGLINGRYEFRKPQAIAITGKNGTGKTTFLRIVSGLHDQYTGVCNYPDHWRPFYVPSELEHFLLPWYTASENLAFYKTRGKSKKPASISNDEKRLSRILEREQDTLSLDKPVYTLSAGEQSVLALSCALSVNADILLLDEIFSSASSSTRSNMVDILTDNVYDDSKLLIFSTHDSGIATSLSDEEIEFDHYEEESW